MQEHFGPSQFYIFLSFSVLLLSEYHIVKKLYPSSHTYTMFILDCFLWLWCTLSVSSSCEVSPTFTPSFLGAAEALTPRSQLKVVTGRTWLFVQALILTIHFWRISEMGVSIFSSLWGRTYPCFLSLCDTSTYKFFPGCMSQESKGIYLLLWILSLFMMHT